MLPDPGAPFALDSGEVKNADMKVLARLKSLKSLIFRFNTVTDVGLKELAGLDNLESIDMGSWDATPAGMKQLAASKICAPWTSVLRVLPMGRCGNWPRPGACRV